MPALEASAFLGFLFPGEIAVLLGGVLAFNGRVPLPAVIAAAVAGAIVGDSIGYAVGRRWGHQLLRGIGRHLPLVGHRIDEHLESANAYLRRRRGAAVFFGRFVGALRVMIPGLAGMAEIPYGTFAFYNVAGGTVWATAFVLLGYLAGAAWRRVAADASRIGLGLLVVVLLGLVASRVIRSRAEGERLADRLARLPPVSWARRRLPGLSGWLARRVDVSSPTGFPLSFVIVAGAVCAWMFVGVTQDVIAREEAALLDPKVESFLLAHRAAWLTVAMKTVTWLGSNAVLVPLVVLIGGTFLLRRHGWRKGAYLVAALVGANLWYLTTKALVARPRPPAADHLIGVSGFAFPSGHATAVVATWGMAALVLGAGRSVRTKIELWSTAVMVSAIVGFSRLYLGVHWWTDVVAGFALGGLWLCALGLLFLMRSRPWAPAPELAGPVEPAPVADRAA